MTLPPVPPGLEFRLEAYLEALKVFCLNLDKRLTGAEGDTSGDGLDLGSTGESYNDITPASLATGTATAAWTTKDVSASVSANATHAVIWAHIEIGSSGDQGSIDFRKDSGSDTRPALKTMTAQSNTDTDSNSGEFRVPLTDTKTFDYQVTGTLNTDAGWELKIVGEYVV